MRCEDVFANPYVDDDNDDDVDRILQRRLLDHK